MLSMIFAMCHDDQILEIQFCKTVDTKSPLKFKPLNPSVKIVECEQIIEILDKPAMLNRKHIMLIKIPNSEDII